MSEDIVQQAVRMIEPDPWNIICNYVAAHEDLERRKIARVQVVVNAVNLLKIALVGSRSIPKPMSDYVKYNIEGALGGDLLPIMLFFDMYNHYKTSIPRLKRRFIIQVFRHLERIFDGSVPNDPEFAYDGDPRNTLGNCWVAIPTNTLPIVDDEDSDGDDLAWLHGDDESFVEDMGVAVMLESSDDESEE